LPAQWEVERGWPSGLGDESRPGQPALAHNSPVTRTGHRRRPRLLMCFLIALAVVEIALPVALALARNRIIFLPSAAPLPEDALVVPRSLDARVVRIVRSDGRRLAAYDLAPKDLSAEAPVVLFLHGNAGNIGDRASLAVWIAQTANVRLLMPDYSGYGGNEGAPSEAEINVDALAACDYLVAQGVPLGRIVVYGESIGGGPAIYLATQRAIAGLALQSTFTSLSAMALRVYPWLPLGALVVRGAFPNAERIATLRMPVLIVHGTADSIVPFAEGQRLAKALPSAEFLPIAGADHNDLFDAGGEGYLRALGDRFRRWTEH